MRRSQRKLIEIRSIYELKRRNTGWKLKKRFAKLNRRKRKERAIEYEKAAFTNRKAPNNFSFIDNTDEVLEYFESCHKNFQNKEKVTFDISDITKLSPDAISLLIASINDEKYICGGDFNGTAPKNTELNKLFSSSGFLNYVSSSKQSRSKHDSVRNLLHKERDYRVRPVIARNVCIKGLKHVTGMNEPKPFEPLYEILIEAMQNTNNHASPKEANRCKWWTYVYNDEDSGKSIYSFMDLGVGIFDSITVKNYIKKIGEQIGLHPNTRYVTDLLDGKVKSRIEEDNDIRGKGIPQIVNNAQLECFERFFIISNDVKIDVKSKVSTKLKNNFSGTFLYWELKKGNCYEY